MATKQHRMKCLTFVLLVVLLVASYIAYALTQPLAALEPRVLALPVPNQSAVTLSWPSYGEAAVGAMHFGVLATHGAMTPLPSASTIKLMTALAVLHEAPLNPGQAGPAITISPADMTSYTKYVAEDGSVVRVALGEQI